MRANYLISIMLGHRTEYALGGRPWIVSSTAINNHGCTLHLQMCVQFDKEDTRRQYGTCTKKTKLIIIEGFTNSQTTC